MARRTYADLVRAGQPVLTDGAAGTRLRYGTPWSPDKHISAASFVTERDQARALLALFVGYTTIAQEFELPVLLYSPTSRAHPYRLARAGFPEDVNERCVRVVCEARARVDGVEAYVAGVVGPANDAYQPAASLAADDARSFHRPHAQLLVDAGSDLLIAAPFPAAPEAAGAASAMADTGSHYIVALIPGADGNLLDGTPLAEAIDRIDNTPAYPPVHYLIQCVHPRLAGMALERLAATAPRVLGRVQGVKANAADAALTDLDAASEVRAADPEVWASHLHSLRERHGSAVLGGCCGTDERHIFSLAVRLGSPGPAGGGR